MPRKTTLTYFANRRRWKKKFKGKVYYLGKPCNKSDRLGYQKALDEWRAIESRLTADAAEEERRKLLEEHEDLHIAVQLARGEEVPGVEVVSGAGSSDIEKALLAAAVESHGLSHQRDFQIAPGPTAAPGSQTVDGQIAAFLARYKLQVTTGKRSLSRLDGLRTHLTHFADWIPPGETTRAGDLSLVALTSPLLAAYHTSQAEAVAAGSVRHYTAHHRMQSLRQFVRALWEMELIPLPRLIDSDAIQIAVPPREVQVWTPEQVKLLLEAASPRSQLYMLLAANCGLTQKDISDLKHSEIDLKAGTLTRMRSKTHRHEGTPLVQYKLWKPTVRLLKDQMTESGRFALTNAKGDPLVCSRIKEDGKLARNDAVKCAFLRAQKKVNARIRRQAGESRKKARLIEGSFKRFRSTSANLLEQSEKFKPVATLFLGHAPASVKDRHYVRADEKLLAEGLDWLAGQYGLDKVKAETVRKAA